MGKTCWRLLQVWITSGGQHCYRKQPVGRGIFPQTLGVRTIGSGGQDNNDGTNDGSSPPSTQPSLHEPRAGRQSFGRLGVRRRPLSPMERISRLLPQDTLSQEVWELREGKEGGDKQGTQGGTHQDLGASGTAEGEVLEVCVGGSTDAQQQEERGRQRQEEEMEAPGDDLEVSGCSQEEKPNPDTGDPSLAPPGERSLSFGELALVEYRKKNRVEFRKMFPLQEGGRLHSNWGMLPHSAVVGRPAGCVYLSSTGSPFLVRRPSLEEYVLLMKRGATIAYPKVGPSPPHTAKTKIKSISASFVVLHLHSHYLFFLNKTKYCQ